MNINKISDELLHKKKDVYIMEDNKLRFQFSINIADQIIDNITECIEKFEVIPMQNKIRLSSLLQPEYVGKIQDYISTYEQFMINFGKVTSDNYGIKIKIESEALNSIQQGIQKRVPSNNLFNDVYVTKEWYLCRFLKQTTENDKKELYKSLSKFMNDPRNKKQAFQEVSKINNDIYLFNKEESEYKYQATSYFYLIKENHHAIYKKRHLQENQGIKGTTFTNKLKLLNKMYGVDVTKYQPFYYSTNSKNKVVAYGERVIPQKSNYAFNRDQYQIINILSELVDEHPFPKSNNDYNHDESIQKAVENVNARDFFDYFGILIKKIMNMDNSTLKKKLMSDFTYQSLCRWYSESENFKLHLEKFMNKVLDSNYYEGSKLFRLLSHSIESAISEFEEDKIHFDNMKNYFLKNDKVKNWEQISDNINVFNGKVKDDIKKEYDKLKSNKIGRNQKLNFDYLYYCFEFSNNIVKAKNKNHIKCILSFQDKYKIELPFLNKMLINNLNQKNIKLNIQKIFEKEKYGSRKYILFFVNKHKIEMPFLDQLLINYLNQEIDQNNINFSMQTMFEKERYDNSSTIEKLMASNSLRHEKEDLDLLKKLFNDVENSIDRLGIYLLSTGIDSVGKNARYYRSFLKELSRMKSKLNIFSLETKNTGDGEGHPFHDVNKEETNHPKQDEEFDIDTEIKKVISDYIDNLLSVKIRHHLYNSSPNIKK